MLLYCAISYPENRLITAMKTSRTYQANQEPLEIKFAKLRYLIGRGFFFDKIIDEVAVWKLLRVYEGSCRYKDMSVSDSRNEHLTTSSCGKQWSVWISFSTGV